LNEENKNQVEIVKKFAEENKVELFMTSALNGNNIPALFEHISNLALKHIPSENEIEESEKV
jgi:hypothetical protein